MTPPPEAPLEILYEDNHYIAINKPSGLLVHRSSIAATETRFAVQRLRDQIGKPVFPAHRIDKPTSGALLFALDESALPGIQTKFEENEISKEYLALVRGHPPDSGEMDRPLRRLLDFGPQRKSDQTQEARTRYKTLSRTELPFPTGKHATTRYSLVALYPETGRRHQLRRHLAHINCPIIGDTRHGDSKQNIAFRERFGFGRLFLHARRLAFEHPVTRAPVEIDAPLSLDFQKALALVELTEH